MSRIQRIGVIKDTIQMLWRMLGYYKPWAWLYFPSMLAWASQDFLGNYIFARFQRDLLAGVIAGKLSGVVSAVLTFLVYQSIFLIIFSVGCYAGIYIQEKVKGSFQGELFAKLLRLPEMSHTGEGLSRLTSDAQQALQGGSNGFGHIFLAGIAFFGSIGVIASVDWRLSLVAIGIGILFTLINISFARPFRRIGDTIQQRTAVGNQQLLDILAGAMTIRLFGLSAAKASEYRQTMAEVRRVEMRKVRLNTGKTAINACQGWLSYAFVVGFGFILVARGEITLPNLMLASGMLGQAIYKLYLLSEVLTSLQHSMAAAARVFEVLDTPSEDLRKQGKLVVPDGSVALEICDVTFSYQKDREPALSHISLQIKPGETVALVGGSGSGKTTLLKLLLGMLEPDEGRIKLWGVECRDAALTAWRHQYAYVAQESSLFDGTLADNIRMGRLDADEMAIQQAAETANAMEFIEEFSQGLHSQAGELGGKLSGGQRQRIAIARAVVRNAPILLLDEATSSLDSESEAAVQKAISALIHNRTSIVAAHRLSTIRHADRIVVLDRGRIIEEGRHDDLLERDGLYTKLWKTQRIA